MSTTTFTDGSCKFQAGEFIWNGGMDTRFTPKGAGFRWDPKRSVWWTKSPDNAKKISAYLEDSALEELARLEGKAAAVRSASSRASSDYDAPAPDGLSYLPYQRAFLSFLRAAKKPGGGVLLADEMGLGKTIQALGAINDHDDFRHTLIVCPASLKLNWAREAEKWLVNKHEICILNGKSKELPPWEARTITIINYDILLKVRPILEKRKFDLIVADESQNLKNYKAKRTQALLGGLMEEKDKETKTLLKSLDAGFWIFLTGTPILNRPNELWTSVKKLDPTGLGENWKKFHMRYCGAKHNGFGWDFKGASHLDELQEKLRSSIMIRRLKADVLKELPPKRRRVIPLEAQTKGTELTLQNEKSLQAKADELRGKIEEKRKLAETLGKPLEELPEEQAFVNQLTALVGETIGEMTSLRAELAEIKARECLPLLADTAEMEPTLIFCHHHSTIDIVMEGLEKRDLRVAKIDGRDSLDKRQERVDAFQAGKLDAMILQIQAAGVGLTLTRSSHVIFLEQDWTPGRMAQAEDRAHRVGQEGSVLVDYLVYDNSMDAHLCTTLFEKEIVIRQAMDNTQEVNIEPEVATESFVEKALEERKQREDWLGESRRKREAERLAQIEELSKKSTQVSDKMTFLLGFWSKGHSAKAQGIIELRDGRKLLIESIYDRVHINGEPYEGDALSIITKFGIIKSCHHLGHCSHCGRALTNPESVATGLGPVCAGRI